MSYNVNYRLKYKMKQILILDDRDIRHLHFKKKFIGKALLTHVYTAKQCIEALNEFTFDAVYLDHDLRSEMEESGPDTGYEVAEWLSLHPDKKPKDIYIHSLNPDGRENMKKILPEAIEQPCFIF